MRRVPALQRHHITHGCGQPALEHAGEARALLRILEPGVERIDVLRQPLLPGQVRDRVLERRHRQLGVDAEQFSQRLGEALRVLERRVALALLLRDESRIAPQWLRIATPVQRKRPARQRLARIPLALAEVQQAARRKPVAQPPDQRGRQRALVGPVRSGVPFRSVDVVDGDERRFAAHRQSHVSPGELFVHGSPQRVDRRPFVLGVRVRHARRFDDPLDVHRERELDVPRIRHAGDRRGAARMRSACERNVALAREQARGGVEADPARTGQVDLGPGVQVGEVLVGAGRPVERRDVRLELDQVTRHETSGESKAPQDLDEQPGGVATGSFPAGQGLLAGLHARLHPDHVVDVLVELPVQFDEEIDRCDRAAIDLAQPLRQQGAGWLELEIRLQFLGNARLVGERVLLGFGLEEEVERIEHRHFGDEVHLQAELTGLPWDHDAGQVVAERILLPVQEVLGRLDAQRVAQDPGAGMRRRPEADNLRPQRRQAVVAIAGLVGQRDVDRHGLNVTTSGSFRFLCPKIRHKTWTGDPSAAFRYTPSG